MENTCEKDLEDKDHRGIAVFYIGMWELVLEANSGILCDVNPSVMCNVYMQ